MKTPLASTILTLCLVGGAFGQVAVIANKSVPLDSISKNTLLDLYTQDIKKWPDGEPVIVKDLKPKNDVKKIFYKFLGKSPSRMKSIWMKKMLSGESDPPEAVTNEQEMVQKIASTPGAIGFVAQESVSSAVKTLLIIKKEP